LFPGRLNGGAATSTRYRTSDSLVTRSVNDTAVSPGATATRRVAIGVPSRLRVTAAWTGTVARSTARTS